jgi:hypothetical protein
MVAESGDGDTDVMCTTEWAWPMFDRRASPLVRVFLVAMLMVLVACSGHPPGQHVPTSGGPVLLDGGSGPSGENCIPFLHGKDYLLGFDTLDHSHGGPVRITRVRLVGAKGISLRGSYVTPISGENMIGVGWSWPLPIARLDPSARRDWRARVAAVGKPRLDVSDGMREWGLSLHLRAKAAPASYKGVEVFYTAGHHHYVTRSASSLKIEKKCF